MGLGRDEAPKSGVGTSQVPPLSPLQLLLSPKRSTKMSNAPRGVVPSQVPICHRVPRESDRDAELDDRRASARSLCMAGWLALDSSLPPRCMAAHVPDLKWTKNSRDAHKNISFTFALV